MDSNLSSDSIMDELRHIIVLLLQISVLIGIFGIVGGIYLCSASSDFNCLFKYGLLIFGTLETLIGIILFLIYSSFSSGFDAIWTPQMQGGIQRDERERQITGWTRAATGAVMIILGISALMLYIGLFV